MLRVDGNGLAGQAALPGTCESQVKVNCAAVGVGFRAATASNKLPLCLGWLDCCFLKFSALEIAVEIMPVGSATLFALENAQQSSNSSAYVPKMALALASRDAYQG